MSSTKKNIIIKKKKLVVKPKTKNVKSKNVKSKNPKTYFGKRGYILYKEHFTDAELDKIKNDLTVTPFQMDDYGQMPPPFPVYGENNNKLYLPKFYGLKNIGSPEIIRLPPGLDIDCKFNGKLRDKQVIPHDVTLKTLKSKGGGILTLPCGFGKTALALYLISELKKKALVIVHKSFLVDQWRERIQQFLPTARIGIIQQDKVDIKDKDIVLGMLQSISMKTYPMNTFDSFGFTIIDECFVGSTRIVTDDGNYKIEHLFNLWSKGGKLPLVFSYNRQYGIFELKQLTHAWKKPYTGGMMKIEFGKKKYCIECTPDHKILTENGYIEAQRLKIGQMIMSKADGYERYTLTKITSISLYSADTFVYDIEVSDNHNFIINYQNNRKKLGIIVSNCHRIPSKVFSQALRKINCKYMLGLSATPNRKDGLTKVLKWFIGDMAYEEKMKNFKTAQVKRYIIQSNNPHYNQERTNYRGKPDRVNMITNIVEYLHRTKIIVRIIQDLILENRKIILLSERRDHLAEIHTLITNQNICSVGLYVGGMKQKDLKLTETKQLILATYSMAREGLDIRGLDTEIFASPVSDIIQALGRIGRDKNMANQPLYIDIVDNFSCFISQSRKRDKVYVQRTYEIEDIKVNDVLKNGDLDIIYSKKRQLKIKTNKNGDQTVSSVSDTKINKAEVAQKNCLFSLDDV